MWMLYYYIVHCSTDTLICKHHFVVLTAIYCMVFFNKAFCQLIKTLFCRPCCNAVSTGFSGKSIRQLQLVQQAAAQVLIKTWTAHHISAVFKSFWLPVCQRTNLNIHWFIIHWQTFHVSWDRVKTKHRAFSFYAPHIWKPERLLQLPVLFWLPLPFIIL